MSTGNVYYHYYNKIVHVNIEELFIYRFTHILTFGFTRGRSLRGAGTEKDILKTTSQSAMRSLAMLVTCLQVMAMLVYQPFNRLKYLNNYSVDCHDILMNPIDW